MASVLITIKHERRFTMGNEKLRGWKELIVEEDGMGTVEIILIIVVLVGLVLIFKDQITRIVESIFSKITKQTNKF